MKKIILYIIILFSFVNLKSEGIKGNHFIFSPFPNIKDYEYRIERGERYFQISLSSDEETEVEISIPHKFYRKIINLLPNKQEIVKIPIEYFSNYYFVTHDEFIEINSKNNISVYLFSITKHSTDASIILPIKSLGNLYSINTIDNASKSLLHLTSLEDSTSIKIIDGLNRSTEYLLNKGQNITLPFDKGFKGIDIESDKNILVFNGVECLNIPDYTCCCDNSFHIVFPENFYFNEYIIIPFEGRSNKSDYLSIMSLENNNNIYINNKFVKSLNKNETIETFINKEYHIKSKYKINVSQYAISSQNFYPFNGDPFKVENLPLNQMCDSISFDIFESEIIKDNFYVTIIKYKDEDCYLNDNLISNFVDIDNTDYSYKTFKIKKGKYKVVSQKGSLVYAYGYGQDDSYGFIAGACFKELPTPPIKLDKVTVNDIKDEKLKSEFKTYYEKYNFDLISTDSLIKLRTEILEEKESEFIVKEIKVPPQVKYGFNTVSFLTDISKSQFPNYHGFNSGLGLQFYLSNKLALRLGYGLIQVSKNIELNDITSNINFDRSATASLRLNLAENRQTILYIAPGINYQDSFIENQYNDGWNIQNGEYSINLKLPVGVEWFFDYNMSISLQYELVYQRFFNKYGLNKERNKFFENYLGYSLRLNNYPTILISYYVN